MSTKTKCIIIEEGLQTSKLPSELEGLVDKRYPYKLGDLNNDDPVTIIELLVPPQDVPSIALHISTKLLPERYYAHFVNQNELVIIFPNLICKVPRHDVLANKRAKIIGNQLFSIPIEQMPFEQMFEVDHPNAKE